MFGSFTIRPTFSRYLISPPSDHNSLRSLRWFTPSPVQIVEELELAGRLDEVLPEGGPQPALQEMTVEEFEESEAVSKGGLRERYLPPPAGPPHLLLKSDPFSRMMETTVEQLATARQSHGYAFSQGRGQLTFLKRLYPSPKQPRKDAVRFALIVEKVSL